MAQTTTMPTDLVGVTSGPHGLVEPRSSQSGDPDVDGRHLHDLRTLYRGGAPEPRLIAAVKAARAAGWSWTPIAIVLDSSRSQVIARFGRGVGHPCMRRRAA
jgi:hypothetical protein